MKPDSAAVNSLKARVKNLAQEQNIPPQLVLQNFMIERFLERLAQTTPTALTSSSKVVF